MSRGGDSITDRILESPITWLITAINLGIFFIAWQKGEHVDTSLTTRTLLAYGGVYRPFVQIGGEYWRLATAVFLHVGWIHLLWNSYAMFGWCARIERKVGTLWFIFAYLTTGIGASAVSVLGHEVPAAGASGAGFGMIGMTLAFLYRIAGSWRAFISDAEVQWILKMSGFWLLLGLTMFRMDNWAHGGGLVLGVGCGLVLGSRRRQRRLAWAAGLAAYIVVWTGLVILACVPGMGIGGGSNP